MRTQQYSKVEAIVAKYKTLASNAEKVKATEKEMQANSGFYIPYDYMRLKFIEQLIARIYNLRAGESGNPEVRKAYLEAGSFYINGLLQDEEEKYLVEHFDEFIDNAFDHANSYISSLFLPFDQPHEWSSLVPYLLENKSGKIFIPYSDDGREFVGLNNCELTVGSGFERSEERRVGKEC